MHEFQAVLRAWLSSHGDSQSELFRQTGVPQTVISRWLSDRPTRPTPANLAKVAPALDAPYEDLMKMCGYLPGEARAHVDSRRAAVRDQLDRWLTAVGPDYEQDFWDYLKTHGESGVNLIRRLKTAVSAPAVPAVSDAVSEQPKRGRKRLGGSNGPLGTRQHTTYRTAPQPRIPANACLAA